MIEQEKIVNALKSIIDAQTKQDIVSAGYVKDLRVSPQNDVQVDIKIPKSSLSQKSQYQSLVNSALKSLVGVNTISIMIEVQKDPLEEGLKNVKHIIAVSSCKGGVGKSTTAVNMAFSLKQQGFKVGIFDADVYGPSLPTMVRTDTASLAVIDDMVQAPEKDGIKLMSFGYTQDHDEAQSAAILRGPMVSQIITQLLKGTAWGELDYLIIDYPPGTGDTQLTLGQLIPIDAAVIVTTPQYISFIDVIKGIEMFDQLKIPTVAVVENMSYFICNQCDEKHMLFGNTLIPRFIKEYGITNSFQFPMTPELTQQCDNGTPFVCSHSTHFVSDLYHQLAKATINEIQVFKAAGYASPTVDYNESDGIIISYKGEQYHFESNRLRSQCQCAHCVDEFTGKRKGVGDSEGIIPLSINVVGNYAVGITWSDDHSSLFPIASLLTVAAKK
jgi:Mrp family chromosome partitioning ATPase/DUF971 family protein